MQISRHLIYFISVAVLPTLIAAKCEKNAPVCSQNCVTAHFQGRAYQKLTNAPISNFPIEVKWIRRGLYFGTNKYRVSGGYTKQDGTFSLTAIVDTGYFRDFSLEVLAGNDGTYFIMSPQYQLDYMPFSEIDPTSMQNIEFQYYPKTSLTIKLRRSLNDSFNSYSMQSSFDNYNNWRFDRGPSKTAKDSSIQVVTTADIYTYIYSQKTNSQNQPYGQKTDSIMCKMGQANVITIDF